MSGLTANEGRKKTTCRLGLGFFCEPFNFIQNSFNCNELHQPPLTHAYHIMTALTIPQKFSYFWFRKGRPEKRKMFLVILSLADPRALSFFCTAKVRFHLLSLKGVGLGVLVCPTFILKYIKNRMYDFWLSQTKDNRRWQNLWSCLKNCGLASRGVVETKTPFITQSCGQRQPTIKS